MRVARGLVGDRAQAEPLRGIEARALDAAVVERETLGLAVFEVQLAIVHPGQRFGHKRLDPGGAHAGAAKEQSVGNGEIGHSQLLKSIASIWAEAGGSERRAIAAGAAPGGGACGGSSQRLGSGLTRLSPARALV